MKRVLIALCALLALAACTKEMNPLESVDKGALQTIQVSVAPFGDQTKTAVSPQGGFTWSSGDQIGIYPVNTTLGAGQTSQQIVFKIIGTGEAKSANFTGTGWGLVTNGAYKYFSYYPYSADAKYNEAFVEYTKIFNQACNDTTNVECTAHLGENDYLYAPQIQPTDAESCTFAFKHLGALVRFNIELPVEAKTKTFTKMEVSAASPIFTLAGKYDPSSATSSSAPEIVKTDSTRMLKVIFNNGEGITPDANGKIYAYFLVAPTAVKDSLLNIKLWDSDNYAYISSKTPTKSDWKSGNMYEHNCTATAKPVDVATDLSVGGKTANCYIVREAGKYKFPANVKGNGWDPLDVDNHNANASITLAGCKAEVVWETVNTGTAPEAGTIVKSAIIEANYVVFDATGKEGNALISVKNIANDSIIWSWHIWSTGEDIGEQTYPNGAGVMMDRNLGALSAEPGNNLTLGFHYQPGRPWPITAGYSFSSWNGRMATTGKTSLWVEEGTTPTRGTLAYSAAHPTHFIYTSSDNYFKNTTKQSNNWLWTDTLSSNPALWRDDVKTMYDPCPIGWRLPSISVWTVAGFSKDTFTFDQSVFGRKLVSTDIYYPATGYRNASSGGLYNVGKDGTYWSGSMSTDSCWNLGIAWLNGGYQWGYQSLTLGCSVRAFKE